MKKRKIKVNNLFNLLKYIIEIIFAIFIVLFCLIVFCQKFFQKENSFFGYRVFTIVTGSMKPELRIGDIILVKETDSKNIKRGDNITYQGMSDDLKGKIVTHQVKNYIDENGKRIFYTKGLTSSTIDPAVYESQVYGVVKYKFIILSLVHRIITNTVGFMIFIVLPLGYIFTIELRTVLLERKRAKLKQKKLEETIEII